MGTVQFYERHKEHAFIERHDRKSPFYERDNENCAF